MKNLKHLVLNTLLCLLAALAPMQLSHAQVIAPEQASFEPVDGTDIVNLITGDMSYSIPLFQVPSPEGGYPVSLFYHSGIGMMQESSWVGLGWNLNSGSINRKLVGVADDQSYDPVEVHVYDPGEKSSIQSLRIGVGTTKVGVGASYTWGTINGERSVSVGLDAQFRIGPVRAQIAYNSFDNSLQMGIGVAVPGAQMNIDSRGNAGLGVQLGPLGVSMSSGSSKASMSVGGFSSQYSMNSSGQGVYELESSSSFFLPLGPITISYGSSSYRWWIDYERITYSYGILYSNLGLDQLSNNTILGHKVQNGDNEMDINENLSDKDSYSNLNYNSNFANYLSPGYDQYNVYSQGLSGTMQISMLKPSILCGMSQLISTDQTPTSNIRSLHYRTNFLKNSTTNSLLVDYPSPENHAFRFLNSNSSFYRFIPPFFSQDKNQVLYNSNNQLTILNGKTSFNASLGKLAYGKHIEYFLNNSISSGQAYSRGFMECNEMKDRRNLFLSSPANSTIGNKVKVTEPEGIGAFYIIKEDGMKYHFSLPVYQFEEFSFTRNHFNHNKWASIIETSPIAINWLLTAITGPDFIDNGDFVVGNGDLGYWVKFNYGLWSDGFIDRTPFIDYKRYGEIQYEIIHGVGVNPISQISNEDDIIDQANASRRQIYYLNSISTRTHTALFVKDIKEDYYSASSFNITGRFDLVGFWDGNPPFRTKLAHNALSIPAIQPTLKLSEIYLLSNEDLAQLSISNNSGNNSLAAPSGQFGSVIAYNRKAPVIFFNSRADYLATVNDNPNYNQTLVPLLSKSYGKYFGFNYQENVLDITDIAALKSQLQTKSLKSVVFNYDYSLKKNKVNKVASVNNPLHGSLSLKSLTLKGKAGVRLLPSYLFSYQKNLDVDTTKMDDWGYMEKFDQDSWSLTEVIEPIGSKVNFLYESDLIDKIYYDGEHQKKFSDQYPYEGGIRVKRVSRSSIGSLVNVDYSYRNGTAPVTPRSFSGYVPNVSFQAGPIVLYEEVDVIEKGLDNKFESYMTYKFNNFYDHKVTQRELPDFPNDHTNLKSSTRRTVIESNLASLGNLLSVSVRNIDGIEIKRQEYNYLKPSQAIERQGVHQESHVSSKLDYSIKFNGAHNPLIHNCSIRTSINSVIEYPNVFVSIEDYDLIAGVKSTTKNVEFDFLTGDVTKSEVIHSDQEKTIRSIVPAYNVYTSMGPIISTSGALDYSRKNMLTQKAKEYTYKNYESIFNLLSATATTFNSNWNYLGIDANGYLTIGSSGMPSVLRKSESYILSAPRLVSGKFHNNWSDFVFGQYNPMWLKEEVVEIYDKFSHPVQSKDRMGNYFANHIDQVQGNQFSTAIGSNVFSFTHTSFEHSATSNPLVNVLLGNGQIVAGTSLPAHTGKKYLQIAPSSTNSFPIFKQRQRVDGNGLTLGTEYTVTAWVNAPLGSTAKLNIRLLGNGGLVNQIVSKGFHDPSNITVGNWKQLTLKILVPTNYTSTNANEDLRVYVTDNATQVSIDDFRVAPSRAVIEGFVYGESGSELTHKLDQNNFYTRMEYDAEGRVKAVYKETLNGEKKIKEYQINYSRN